FGRRADVAALGVQDDDKTRLARLGADHFKRGHALSAPALEQSGLRFDGGDAPGAEAHERPSPAGGGLRTFGPEHCGYEGGVRIDADAERPVRAGAGDEAIGKRPAHAATLQSTLTIAFALRSRSASRV